MTWARLSLNASSSKCLGSRKCSASLSVFVKEAGFVEPTGRLVGAGKIVARNNDMWIVDFENMLTVYEISFRNFKAFSISPVLR